MLKEQLNKIFPIKSFDIRIAKLDEQSDVVVTDKEVVSEEVKIRNKDKGVAHAPEQEQQEVPEQEQLDDSDDEQAQDDDSTQESDELDTSDEELSDEELEAQVEEKDKL